MALPFLGDLLGLQFRQLFLPGQAGYLAILLLQISPLGRARLGALPGYAFEGKGGPLLWRGGFLFRPLQFHPLREEGADLALQLLQFRFLFLDLQRFLRLFALLQGGSLHLLDDLLLPPLLLLQDAQGTLLKGALPDLGLRDRLCGDGGLLLDEYLPLGIPSDLYLQRFRFQRLRNAFRNRRRFRFHARFLRLLRHHRLH